MRLLLWLLVLAVVAVVAALLSKGSGGNLVLLLPPYRVDVSVHFAVILLLALLLLVYWLSRLAHQFNEFPRRVALYRERRGELGGQRALRAALQALLEGRFARAERAAQSAQAVPEIAGLAALIGARAAHRMREHERRDSWLVQAEQDESMDVARLITSAELWTEGREVQRALDALQELDKKAGRHIHGLRVALQAYAQARRWEDVLKVVRILQKRNALHETLARRLKLWAYREILAARRNDASALQAAWESIPAEDRRLTELVLVAAHWLNLAGRGRAAAIAIETALEHDWDERLLDEYAKVPAAPARERIEHAENWLRQHPDDAAVLRCLGLLCLREQLWGKARAYLEDSLRQKVHPATLLALANLADSTGKEADAAHYYREAALGLANLLHETSAAHSRQAMPVQFTL